MTHRSSIVCVCSLLVLSCSTGSLRKSERLGVTVIPAGLSHDEDTSEIPRPEETVAVMRLPAFHSLASSIARLTGTGDLATLALDEIYQNVISEPALANIADRNAPLDIAWTFDRQEHIVPVLAFAAPPLEQIPMVLGRTWHSRPIENGMLVLEPEVVSHDATTVSEQQAARPHMRCLAAPTPVPTASAVVCVEWWEHDGEPVLRTVAPYMARTLTRTHVPNDTILIDLDPAPLRRHFGQNAAQWVDRLYRTSLAGLNSATSVPLRIPAVRQALTHVSSDLFDNLRSALDDARSIHARVVLGTTSLTWDTTIDMGPVPSGTLVRGLAASLSVRTPLSQDALRVLPPGAAFYAIASIDDTDLRPAVAPVAELIDVLISEGANLSAENGTALRDSLRGLFSTGPSETVTAYGAGSEGDPWLVGRMVRTRGTGAELLGRVRAVFDVLRRPAVLRSLDGLGGSFRGRVRGMRELPPSSVPNGGWGFSLPALSTVGASSNTAPTGVAPGRPNRARPIGHIGESQYLFVPDGNALLYVSGNDVKALYARVSGNASPGIDPLRVTVNPAAFTLGFVPSGLPPMLRADHADQATQIEQSLLAQTDHGQTPIVLTLDGEHDDSSTRYTLRVVIEQTTISWLGSLLLGLSGNSTRP